MTKQQIKDHATKNLPVWIYGKFRDIQCTIHGIDTDICDVSLIADYGSSFALSWSDAQELLND